MSTHYVVHVRIERVDIADGKPSPLAHLAHQAPVERRTVTELAGFVVKGDDLDTLKSKIGAHLDLVEDITATDGVRAGKRETR